MYRKLQVTVVLPTVGIALLIGGCNAPRERVAPLTNVDVAVKGGDFRDKLMIVTSRDSDRGMILTIPDVLFEVDKADLRTSAQPDLAAIAGFLKDHPEQKVLIEGHTDSTGASSHNHELSLRRGTNVETFFLKNGVDPKTVEVRGLGEERPIASNATAAGRQQNRRVEIVMLKAIGDKTVQTYP